MKRIVRVFAYILLVLPIIMLIIIDIAYQEFSLSGCL